MPELDVFLLLKVTCSKRSYILFNQEKKSHLLTICLITAGIITTKANLNYETLGQTNFELTVTVSDAIATVTSTVTLTVLDVNEAPTFTSNTYRTNVQDGAVGYCHSQHNTWTIQ